MVIKGYNVKVECKTVRDVRFNRANRGGKMPVFYFRAPEEKTAPGPEEQLQFDNLDQAVEHARYAVCDLASDFLPISPSDTITIEIHSQDGVVEAEVRLTLHVLRRAI